MSSKFFWESQGNALTTSTIRAPQIIQASYDFWKKLNHYCNTDSGTVHLQNVVAFGKLIFSFFLLSDTSEESTYFAKFLTNEKVTMI